MMELMHRVVDAASSLVWHVALQPVHVVAVDGTGMRVVTALLDVFMTRLHGLTVVRHAPCAEEPWASGASNRPTVVKIRKCRSATWRTRRRTVSHTGACDLTGEVGWVWHVRGLQTRAYGDVDAVDTVLQSRLLSLCRHLWLMLLTVKCHKSIHGGVVDGVCDVFPWESRRAWVHVHTSSTRAWDGRRGRRCGKTRLDERSRAALADVKTTGRLVTRRRRCQTHRTDRDVVDLLAYLFPDLLPDIHVQDILLIRRRGKRRRVATVQEELRETPAQKIVRELLLTERRPYTTHLLGQWSRGHPQS